jgi:hypothetical protein
MIEEAKNSKSIQPKMSDDLSDLELTSSLRGSLRFKYREREPEHPDSLDDIPDLDLENNSVKTRKGMKKSLDRSNLSKYREVEDDFDSDLAHVENINEKTFARFKGRDVHTSNAIPFDSDTEKVICLFL